MGFWGKIFALGRQTKDDSLPIYDDYKDAPQNSLFRLPNDPPTTIRINQSYSEELLKDHDIIDEYWTMVAGVSYRTEEVNSFVSGTNRSVFIKHEQSNKYPHALAVYGIWKDKKGYHQKKQLGYVPDDEARQIAEQIKTITNHNFATKLGVLYLPTREKSAGIRFDFVVLCPALPRFEVHGIGKDSCRKRKKTYIAKDKEEAIQKALTDGIIVDTDNIKQL